MIIKNQNNLHITDRHDQTTYREKITHLANNCYTEMILDGKKVSIISDGMIDDERVVVVNVEGLV